MWPPTRCPEPRPAASPPASSSPAPAASPSSPSHPPPPPPLRPSSLPTGSDGRGWCL
ncbi:unnamed protein product [Spirodela intermedia]|uniref:Uncharacterized protein n=1 Tax=Spirodela intermedia TaxID=51605 RepID=A0A7I8LIW3_SPIIN|nr:unnamed protein product [Spirodela intermedia]